MSTHNEATHSKAPARENTDKLVAPVVGINEDDPRLTNRLTQPRFIPGPGGYTKSVIDFLEACPWLSKVDSPAVTTLISVAFELDKRLTAAMVAQFNLTYRHLLTRSPAASTPDDEIDKLLGDVQNG